MKTPTRAVSGMSGPRQQWKLGSVVEIPLVNGKFACAALQEELIAIFDLCYSQRPDVGDLSADHILTRLSVYRRVITKGFWVKFARVDDPMIIDVEPERFMLDTFTEEFRAYHSTYEGYERPSTYEHCKDLECSAVWDAPHVEERLNAHFFGMDCRIPITASEHLEANRKRRKLPKNQRHGIIE